MKSNHLIAIVGFVAVSMTPAFGEYFLDTDPIASGNQPGSIYVPRSAPGGTVNSTSEGWEQLTAGQNPDVNVGFPGNDDWEDVAFSHVGTYQGNSYFFKTANGPGDAGGPYPASASIYFGGTNPTHNYDGGELTVFTDSGQVLTGVKTVVFQLDIGEAWTYDLYAVPVLHYTLSGGGGGSVSAAYQSLYKEVANGQVYMDGKWEDLNINSRAYQFNLNGLGTIESFSISFKGVQHAQVYGAGLQQFDAAAGASILPANVP